MDIPYQQLPKDVLAAIIEEFVSREGTEYGAEDYSMESKVAQVLKQIEKGEVVIDYDEDNQSCQLVVANS